VKDARGIKRDDSMIHLVRTAKAMIGWQFRIPEWHPEGPGSRFFEDRAHGGSDAALQAARSCRDDMFAKAHLPLRRDVRVEAGKRTKSGIPGVFLKVTRRQTGGWIVGWAATWQRDQGKQTRAFFSIKEHGFEGALRMAVHLREQTTGLKFSADDLKAALSLEASVRDKL